ncbi:MAG: CPBP family intramembrane metalloprotease [Anaerolineales bacterium]|nr:CPBP family intramembrane metalloprotease [Anaerolineales bacterium]
MRNHNLSLNAFSRCGIYTVVVIGFWTIWCLLMVVWPQVFAQPTIRAIARVSIVLIPSLIFCWQENQQQSIFDYFLLRENWVRGVIVGGGVAILYFGADWLLNFDVKQSAFHFPVGFPIWFNFILGSPFAEELFFRGVLLKELCMTVGAIWATLISAFAFALLHLPQWLLLDNLFGFELLLLFVTIFFYGIIFALLVNLTRSLWGSLIPHWINNFILLAIR